MTFLSMVVNQGQLSPHLIKEKTSIGLKKHQENIQIKKLQIFFLQTLLQPTHLKIYGLEK